MAYQLWSQDNFSKGELSPYMYARAQTAMYYDGLKVAQNALTYPTGAAGTRFGTLYQATLNAAITSFNQIFFQTFQWLDNAVFQLVFRPLAVDIYLEGIIQATVVTTLDAVDVFNLDYTVLQQAFRISGEAIGKPKDLTVVKGAANAISVVNANSFTLTNPVDTATIFPVSFHNNTPANLPTSDPQIKNDLVYFARRTGASTVEIYNTAFDAKFQLNKFTITAASGTPTTNMFTFTTWAINDFAIQNYPIYDFDGGYDAINFTPAAVTGNTTLAASSSIFTVAMVGGAFIGGGGTARITNFNSGTSVDISVQDPFEGTTPIRGSLALLAEPAWSDARGWPQKCSSYQNRALFANTASLPNGFWASVTNDYKDFGDLTTDDDDAIFWLPSSNDINVIRFIVPFRSITVHTNSGIYSSPLSEVSPITPSTFTLQLQDSTPADVLQPQAIDNQIIVLSGNDVHTMLWDGINNAYTSNIVSVASEQTIRDPVDEAAFADLRRAGSRYVMIINANGTLAVYQTLQSENVSGFTPHILEQSYGHASFRQVASNFDGRCWFVNERQIASNVAPIAITGFTPASVGVNSTLTAIGIQAVLNPVDSDGNPVPTAITFTTSGTLPVTSPAIAIQTYYWALATGANTFVVYLSQDDAIADENAIAFTSAGTSSNVVAWPLATIFTLEELTQDTHLDCAFYYNSTPTDVITTGALFNAQAVKMVGDGFGFDAIGVNNTVSFESHGDPVNVTEAYIGFPINLIIEPMPISPPPNQMTTLTKPTHIRFARFMFNNTIGGTINGVPISLVPFDQADIGQPPIPARGVFEMAIMSGWDDFNLPSFTIEHNDPFNLQLIGIFYSVDV
jgi:hypothetical protein